LIFGEKSENVSMPQSYRVEKWQQFYMPNPAMLRNLLAMEGYSVFQWSDSPGTIYGMHKHDDDQSHWVISGSLELRTESSGTHVLNAGDRDFMPANTYHSARVLGSEPALYLVGAKPHVVEVEAEPDWKALVPEKPKRRAAKKPAKRKRKNKAAK
jgi:quercetin dioxygenase-like cupin family protein